MTRQITCECGRIIRHDDEDMLIDLVREHIRADHPELLEAATSEMIRNWLEIVP